MLNWSDEELDRLSREAAERFDPPAPDGGWEALSRRLDVEMPVRDKRRRAFFWLLFAGLLLGGSAYWAIFGKRTFTKENIVSTDQQAGLFKRAQGEDEKMPGVADVTPHAPVISNAGKKPAPTSSSIPSSSSSSTTSNHYNLRKSSNASLQHGDDFRVVHVPVAAVSKGTGTGRKGQVKQYQGKVPPAEAVNGAELPVPARSVVAEINHASAPAVEPVLDPAKPEVNEQPKSSLEQPLAPATMTAPDKRPGRWVFSLSVAPDLSAVEFYPLAKPGIFFGGTVGYHLSERWTISTGLYYTVKHYDAPGDTYNVNGTWFANPNIKMKQVNAVCNMFDIPVNLRYDFYSRSNTRLYASSGLSSYLMRKEDLHYYYTYYNNPYDKSYVYHNGKNYWFAVANLSAGMERKIGQGFSLQVEPFAKFSLAEVGTGKIKLNSYGLLVGLTYRPFKVVHPQH